MEQPNATSDGPGALTWKFWLAAVVVGVVTGLLGDALMWLLFSVEHLAFNYQHGSLEQAVKGTSYPRRVVVLTLAGLIGGVAWYLLRRYTKKGKSEVDDALWAGDGRLSISRSFGTSVISEVVVAMGASIGREAAPKLLGGVSASAVSDWLELTDAQRKLLVACGAGAGLACVYNVPVAGALFATEILLGSVTVPTALPALAVSGIATVVAWLYLPTHATYIHLPAYAITTSLTVWAVPAGVLIGAFAAGAIRLVGWVSHHRLPGLASVLGMVAVFAGLGALGILYPQLFGNGKDLADDAFLGMSGTTLLLAYFVLKPIVTSLCLGAGASGGLFTPFLSTGAALGAFLGVAWSHLWSGTPTGAFALVGAAAMIGAAMQAPLTGLVVVLELTSRSGFGVAVPMLAATIVATIVVRYIDGYSIYSARLPAHPAPGGV